MKEVSYLSVESSSNKICGFQEGVGGLRNRFGFIRPQAKSYKVSSSTINNSDRNILKKIQYFNSNNDQNVSLHSPRQARTHSVKKEFKDSKVKSPRETRKNSAKVNVTVKENNESSASKLRKPLFVTKYSPYRGGESEKQSSAPLIMTAGNSSLHT